ncbi:MAG: EI24 domain-containing protein [Rhodocyclaceae bacterium]|nr:EI24 domain-containing protein [Rhodocyclaceae bacterium]
MNEAAWIAKLFAASMRELLRPRIFLHALWPPLLALMLWLALAFWFWQPAAQWVQTRLPEWISYTGFAFIEWGIAHGVLVLLFVPLVYLTTLFLLSLFALPAMMSEIAASGYADLVRRQHGFPVLWGSLMANLKAALLYLCAWFLCLPFFWIPGMLLIVPLLLNAWLITQTFRFDALAEHASRAEREALYRRLRAPFYLAGFLGALLSYLPLINLIAPALTAIIFVHLGLSGLRMLRREQGAYA